MATQESGLTHEQMTFFQSAGYFKIPQVLNEKQTDRLRTFILNESESTQSHKMYGLYDRNPLLIHQLLTNSILQSHLTSLLGPNVVFVKNRHNHATINSPEDVQDAGRLHRDILQPTRGLLTAAVYLEDSTLENGCTHIVPGSQFLPYMGVPQQNGGGTWMDQHPEYTGLLDQALPVPMPKGGVLLFNGLAFHSVGINRSNTTRTSITLGFRSIDELDLRPDLDRQVLVAGQFIYRGNDI